MPDKRNQTLRSLPVANYSPAIARALGHPHQVRRDMRRWQQKS
jgi:hypothetical protein